jgi:hypothetical protein
VHLLAEAADPLPGLTCATLSTKMSLHLLVVDRNDKVPRVLYPSLSPDDMVRSALKPGYMVTKVVVVITYSGYNTRLDLPSAADQESLTLQSRAAPRQYSHSSSWGDRDMTTINCT